MLGPGAIKSYSLSTRLKLGLFIGAILIAVASLAYSHQLISKLRDREQIVVRLWASALERVEAASRRSDNPYRSELRELYDVLSARPELLGRTAAIDRYRAALRWAESMPPSPDLSFILDNVLQPIQFDIPAIIADEAGEPVLWHNVPVDSSLAGLSSADSVRAVERLKRIMDRMKAGYEPITMSLTDASGATVYVQQIFYGDSKLVRALRVFPYVQLIFVSLFVLVGYLGFSHVRRDEQSSLWVGMAREAAHQLGTPLSSLMGWIALLRDRDTPSEQKQMALDELEVDADRLKRVTNRFSDIGSMPRFTVESMGDVLRSSVAYIERRLPQRAAVVELDLRIDEGLRASINSELFEWVVENLLKNALDSLEGRGGRIVIEALRVDRRIRIDISDTGRGIDRRNWKDVFRPGYSTKTRGWGLGLSLSRRIVENYHGGELTLVRSRPGEGTTFRIELPVPND